jgi:hypothetical protein
MGRISGTFFLFLIALVAPAFAQCHTVFPQVAVGGGWSSELFFANQGLQTVSPVIVNFFDGNGNALWLQTSLGTNSQFAFSLSPGMTQTITITPPNSLVTGYAVAEYPSDGSPVRANLVYRYAQDGIVQTVVGVPQQEQGDHFSFPVEINSSERIDTAVALINPVAFNGGVAETVIVNLINPDGSIHATASVPMTPGQHIAQYFDQSGLFPGLDNFIGSASISSPFGVGVLALRQESNTFGGISTDSGPILGPFMLSGTTISMSAQGYNQAPQDAQVISGSTIITGTIQQPGYYNAFQFKGTAGEIISVICNTQGTGSPLDSILYVYDNNGQTIIAQNDQNGLAPEGYPENDSFVQMALPASGTYYITVTDAFGNGGSNYTYTLYVKLQ